LSQGDVARILFVTQQAVSKWESGKGYPDLPTLQALAKLYGVTVDSLVGVEEYENGVKQRSIHPSPVFALVLLADLVALILVDFISGSFVRLFRDFLDNVGITRIFIFVSSGFFFLSCIALVLFILLSQSRKLKIVRFGEYDGLFFGVYFIIISLLDRFLNPQLSQGHATYLLIAVAALLFAALFFYYERETLLLRRKAGVPGIKLTAIEEAMVSRGAKSERLFWGGLLALIALVVIGVSFLPFF
jgi:transcriptional regulator with XRE-family HTH domain